MGKATTRKQVGTAVGQLILTVGVCLAWTQQPARPPLLNESRQRALFKVGRTPNHICVETIERWTRDSHSPTFRRTDKLRVEVTVIGGKESFGWPGGSRLEDADLAEIIGEGMVATGDFGGLLLRDILTTPGAILLAAGEEQMNGTRSFRFEYRIPKAVSRYQIHVRGNEAIAGHHGSFWVEVESRDLVRLELRADDIPDELGVAQVSTNIEYAKSVLDHSDFLLPRKTEAILEEKSGAASRNVTEFSGCRQYASLAVVRFDTPLAGPAAEPTTATKEIRLPDGLSVELELAGAVDSVSAAVGDPVVGTVRTEVRRQREVFVPKGAIVRGRIRKLHLDRHPRVGDFFTVTLEFLELQFGATRAPFVAKLSEVGKPRKLQSDLSSDRFSRDLPVQPPTMNTGSGFPLGGRVAGPGALVFMKAPEQRSNTVTFLVRGDRFRFEGLRMVWRTWQRP